MRDSTLHIKKSDLVKVLKDIDIRRGMSELEIVDEIFNKASKYQLRTRYLNLLNAKAATQKKLKRTVEADDGIPDKSVELFNRLLTSTRQLNNPNGVVKPIMKTSRDYVLLKEVTKLAHDFVTSFGIPKVDKGYQMFINLGIAKMRKYGLNRFKTYASSISESYDNTLTVNAEMAKDKQGVIDFLLIWQEVMREYCGDGMDNLYNIDDNDDKMIHIVHGKRQADELEAPYEYWIAAQFEGLSFLDTIPELYQYYGENAEKRYERFVQKSIEVSESSQEQNDIKNIYYGD